MDNQEMKKLCKLLYPTLAIIMALVVILSYSMMAILFTSLALIICITYPYINRKRAAGTIYESHFNWMIRSFWLAMLLYLPALTAITIVVILRAIDISSLMDQVYMGQMIDPEELMNQMSGRPLYIVIALEALYLGWWFSRCWTGWKALQQDQPVKDVDRLY